MTDLEWLAIKRAELRRANKMEFMLGILPHNSWDHARFLSIINDRDKEIKNLRIIIKVRRER